LCENLPEGDKTNFIRSETIKEHIVFVLPFQVVEKIVDKPLRIRGVAMTAGMSRNFNIYTAEELQSFAGKLVNAPVYIELVAVPNAVGKVTRAEWDGRALWYEAEIYESEVADKIRKGLIQHVSVGADYEAIDVVDGKVPRGLHNAELSLVAVPGIPETSISVLEALGSGVERKVVKAGSCVFCGKPANYLVSSCKDCFERFPAGQEKQDESAVASGKSVVEAADSELKLLRERFAQSEAKLVSSESALAEAQRVIEQLRAAQQCTSSLVRDQPVCIPVAEAVGILEGLLPAPAVERSTLGMQRECQLIRAAIYRLKARLV